MFLMPKIVRDLFINAVSSSPFGFIVPYQFEALVVLLSDMLEVFSCLSILDIRHFPFMFLKGFTHEKIIFLFIQKIERNIINMEISLDVDIFRK